MSTDLCDLPVHALSAGLAARRFSPVDVVEACLTRIAVLEPKLHAFVALYGAEARLAAEAADKAIRSGHGLGPLHGIPIALKDLVELEGRLTTGGSQAWHQRVSHQTATLADKLIGAGMIVLGKTHTVEFALGGWGTNQHRGTPFNPWDMAVQRVPGGSSSGSGVAVAARMTPCAIGTDTGGSIRIPAAWCGITGLKTTIGRISTHGVLPLSPTLDTPGPMTRSVEDCAILLALLQGGDAHDPKTFALPPSAPLAELRRGVKQLRLARMPDEERSLIDPEVLAAYDRSLNQLAGLGAEIVTLPKAIASLRQIGEPVGSIMATEVYPLVASLVDDPAAPLDEAVRTRVLAGAKVSARQYLDILSGRGRAKRDFAAAMEGIDAILTPTAMKPAPKLSEVDQVSVPPVLTRWVNYLDLCALALPNGMTASRLPTSLQIVCRGGGEAMALRIGWALEQATDWQKMAPVALG